MASNTNAFDIAFNRVRATIEDGFYGAVEDRISVLQTNLDMTVKEMFEDISLSFGGDAVPSEISGYTSWADLTEGWIDRKTSESNRFYIGLRGAMKRAIENRAKKFAYGQPTILMGQGVGRGFSRDRSNRLRVARGFAGAGRFASTASALRVTLTITPFPSLGDDPTSIFTGKLGIKVGTGEYGDERTGRPSRPFLYPFIRYYTEVKVPEVIDRTIRR